MVCESCKKDKPDVTMRMDPYRNELEGDETLYPMCDDCERESARDI